MGRDVTADATPLLKNAEQNIGNSAIIQPQAGLPTVIPQTNPARILDLSGGSASGQTMSIVFTATRLSRGVDNPNPGFPGPVTGILEFGNGGRFTRVEFDIPVGPFDGALNVASNAVEPQDGMVIVQVPTGIVRAYARYDNLLLAPLLGTNPPMSAAQWNNLNSPPFTAVPVVGPGGPVIVDAPPAVPPEPVLVKAMTAYFSKARSKVYKTLNCYISNEVAAPAQIQIGNPPVALVGGFNFYAFWALPAFTKRIKILRFDDTVALAVLLHDGIRPVDFLNIPGGTSAPEIEIVGAENIIGITTGSPPTGVTVKMLKLVCEIGI